MVVQSARRPAAPAPRTAADRNGLSGPGGARRRDRSLGRDSARGPGNAGVGAAVATGCPRAAPRRQTFAATAAMQAEFAETYRLANEPGLFRKTLPVEPGEAVLRFKFPPAPRASANAASMSKDKATMRPRRPTSRLSPLRPSRRRHRRIGRGGPAQEGRASRKKKGRERPSPDGSFYLPARRQAAGYWRSERRFLARRRCARPTRCRHRAPGSSRSRAQE